MNTRANRHTLTIRHIQQEDFGNYRWVLEEATQVGGHNKALSVASCQFWLQCSVDLVNLLTFATTYSTFDQLPLVSPQTLISVCVCVCCVQCLVFGRAVKRVLTIMSANKFSTSMSICLKHIKEAEVSPCWHNISCAKFLFYPARGERVVPPRAIHRHLPHATWHGQPLSLASPNSLTATCQRCDGEWLFLWNVFGLA